jgi:hypothetical protein
VTGVAPTDRKSSRSPYAVAMVTMLR